MHRALLLCAAFIATLVISFSPAYATADSLVLNGSASYVQLTRDYYLGGLYLPQKSDDPNYIHSPSIAKRMQMIIQIPAWSPRRWSQVWQNNIAINNENLSPSPQMQQALMQFTSFPKAELRAGDEVVIDFQPNGNSRVLLNGETVLEVPGSEFFNYMVNTWIGSLPPTREFRQRILGQIATDAQQANTLQAYQAPRAGLWASWIAAEQAALEEARKAEERRLAAEAAAEKRRAEEVARRAEEQRQQEEQARLAAVTAAATAAAQKASTPKAAPAAAKVATAAKPSAAKETKTPSVAAKSNTTAAQQVADEQSYYLQMLQWELQRKVAANVSYPAWARQFGQEGLVVIDFRLHRNKELSDIQVRDPSISDILIREVQSALRKAVNSQPIADTLAGNSWLLKAQYNFNLHNTPQPSLTMPAAPASLQNKQSANATQMIEDYRQQQIERIVGAVSYPPGARIMKKQDLVSINVTLDKTGNIKEITELKSSRHRELGQALSDAAKSSAPFPVFPLGIEQEEISFTVEYDFKL